MLPMCDFTVRSLTHKSPAISLFVRPRAIITSTSDSRDVSRSSPSDSVRGCARRRASRRGVTRGSSHDPPEAVVRIAVTRSSAGESLSRNPAAPASIAPHRTSSSSNVVSISTGGGGACRTACSASSRRVAVMPSVPGIRTSISTTSGRWAAITDSASPPSDASATTIRSSSVSRINRRPARTNA